jgi:hypothetical protein
MKTKKVVKQKPDAPKNKAEPTEKSQINKDSEEAPDKQILSEEELDELCEEGRKYGKEKEIEEKELKKISDGIWKERREFELNQIRKNNKNREQEIER